VSAPDVPPPFLPEGDGLVVIDTRAGLDHFALLQVIGALSIETATGMRHSGGSVLNLARHRYGVQSRTKRGALRELRDLYRATYGRDCSIGARLD